MSVRRYSSLATGSKGSITRVPGSQFDSFRRANSTGLGTSDTGQAWTNINNGFNISSNKAVAVSNSALNTAGIPTSSADIYGRVTMTCGVGFGGGLALRLTSTSGGNWFEVQQLASLFRIMRVTNGGGFVLLSSAGVSVSSGQVITIEAWAVGPIITAKMNGANYLAAVDTQNQTVSTHGLYSEDTSCSFNDLVYQAI